MKILLSIILLTIGCSKPQVNPIIDHSRSVDDDENIIVLYRYIKNNEKDKFINLLKNLNDSLFKIKIDGKSFILRTVEELEDDDILLDYISYIIKNKDVISKTEYNELDYFIEKYYKEGGSLYRQLIQVIIEKDRSLLTSFKYKSIDILPCVHLAAKNDDIDMISYIYSKNKEALDFIDYYGNTPIYYSMLNDKINSFLKLLELGSKYNLDLYLKKSKELSNSNFNKILFNHLNKIDNKDKSNEVLKEKLKYLICIDLVKNSRNLGSLTSEDISRSLYSVLGSLLSYDCSLRNFRNDIDACDDEIIDESFQVRFDFNSLNAGLSALDLDGMIDDPSKKQTNVKVMGVDTHLHISTGNRLGDIAANDVVSGAINGAIKGIMTGDPIEGVEKFAVGILKGGVKCVITLLMDPEVQHQLEHFGKDALKGLENTGFTIKNAFEHQVKDAFVNFGNDIKKAFTQDAKKAFEDFGNNTKKAFEDFGDDVKAAFDAGYRHEREIRRRANFVNDENAHKTHAIDLLNSKNRVIEQSKSRIKNDYKVDGEDKWQKSNEKKAIYKNIPDIFHFNFGKPKYIDILFITNDDIKKLTNLEIRNTDSDNEINNIRNDFNNAIRSLAESDIKLNFLIKLEFDLKQNEIRKSAVLATLNKMKSTIEKDNLIKQIQIIKDSIKETYKMSVLLTDKKLSYSPINNSKDSFNLDSNKDNKEFIQDILNQIIKIAEDLRDKEKNELFNKIKNLSKNIKDKYQLYVNIHSENVDTSTILDNNAYVEKLNLKNYNRNSLNLIVDKLNKKIKELDDKKRDTERLAKEKADKELKDRLAKEKADKELKDRLAKEEADKQLKDTIDKTDTDQGLINDEQTSNIVNTDQDNQQPVIDTVQDTQQIDALQDSQQTGDAQISQSADNGQDPLNDKIDTIQDTTEDSQI